MHEKTFYLIRHAEPDFPNGEKMYLGQKADLPLSPAGLEQAAQLGRDFRSVKLDAVYTSPLLRARQTAAPIAGAGVPLCELEALRELSAGEWDGCTFADVRAKYPQYFAQDVVFSCPPGGESDEEGLARGRAALAAIERETPHCAAIVAHSALIRLLLCDLLGRSLHEKKALRQRYAAVSVLRLSQGVWTVEQTGLSARDAVQHTGGRTEQA